MVLSRQEIIELAERARPIFERVARSPNDAASDDSTAEAMLEKWCRTTAQGDWQTFAKRLGWDGIQLTDARQILRDDVPQSSEVPPWSETLNAMLAAVHDYAEELAGRDQRQAAADRFLDAEHPLPFEDLFVPVVRYAGRQVADRTSAAYELLSGDAHASIERALLRVLVNTSSRALFVEFDAFRTMRVGNDRALYQEFVRAILGSLLPAFFQEYSVLARLVAIVIGSWIDASSELLTRLRADQELIRATFNVPHDLGQVVAVTPNLSDPHNGRRFVAALTFGNGFKVVYKPRDLELEREFQQLLTWLNEQGLPLAMRTLTVLTRPGYGWVEFIEQAACDDGDAAREYFTRMGTLLCLGYAFEGVDLHHENVMTCGAHPIVVDAEAFFYPKPRRAELKVGPGSQALTIAREQVQGSVLKTGLLPETRIAADGVSYDVSALGTAEQLRLPGRAIQWRDVNTDAMGCDMVAVIQAANTLAPPSTGYVSELVEGFEQTYRFLLAHRDALISEAGPLQPFAGLPVRFMIRATRVYAVLLQNALHPRYLRSGIDRSIAFDALSLAFLRSAERPYIWPVVQAEHRALEQLDVPRFTATVDGTWLATSPHERINECFVESGHARVLARLSQLDDEDLHRQISFIRGAFLGRYENGHAAGGVTPSQGPPDAPTDARELTADVALEECRKIAALLDSLAIRSDDGSASWIGLSCVLQTRQSSVRLLDMGLHDGVSGIVVFLAALAKITHESQYAELARAALAPVRFTLRDPQHRDRACKRVGIGGAFGVGSLIYSLVVTSLLLDDAGLLEDAALAASFVSRDRVQEDETLDVFLGSAGTILGLLKLYRVAGDNGILEQARTCARHIVSRQIPGGNARGGWPGVDGRPMSGLSHGAAGIAYSLTKLYEVAPEAETIRAASAAIAFERTLFVPGAGNWSRSDAPEERSPTALRASWCRGAPGIALSRLGMLEVTADSHVREDLEVALQTTSSQTLGNIDHLCCGNLGRADILFTAGQQLGRSDLCQTALRNASDVVTRTNHVGEWAIEERGGPHRNGFFQGRAGIGYTLLRLTHPDALPAVLMWQ